MLYDSTFFEKRKAGVNASASVMVPLLVEMFHPTSVVDVGCAQGEWLRQFLDCDVPRVLGIDGEYVDQDALEIPRELFLDKDLAGLTASEVFGATNVKAPFQLALSLEVAEHLPGSAADQFVALLASLAEIVVFSAAVPNQNGVGHINCQWPTYWIERFQEHGYLLTDPIRPRIWQNPMVASWYQQNVFVFAPEGVIDAHPVLSDASREPYELPYTIMRGILWNGQPGIRTSLRHLINAVKHSLGYRTQRLHSRSGE